MREIGLDLWYQALQSPSGIRLKTDDPDRARQRLYALRREANDEELKSVSIAFINGELWLVKRSEDGEGKT